MPVNPLLSSPFPIDIGRVLTSGAQRACANAYGGLVEGSSRGEESGHGLGRVHTPAA